MELIEDATCVQEVKANLCISCMILNLYMNIIRNCQKRKLFKVRLNGLNPKWLTSTLFSFVSEWLSGVSKAGEAQEIEVAPKKTAYLKSPFVSPEKDHFQLLLQV